MWAPLDGAWISLREYVARVQPDQKDIYFITGDNLAALINSPLLEQLKEKDYEVLLMTDPVDEWVVQSLTEYDGKALKSAEKGELDIEQVDEATKGRFEALFKHIRAALEDSVKEVKPSTRLKNSVACLSGEAYDMSAYMEKILRSAGQTPPQAKRVLELNTGHPVIEKMAALFEKDKDDATLKDYTQLLLDLAVIGEGGKVADPSRFSKLVGDLMAASG